jgi:DNA-binding PadR family transcriptional regulator
LVKDLENPGLRTLIAFLDLVSRNAPSNFTALSRERRGYSMVSRYLRFCLEHRLIKVVDERRTRVRYTSKTYALSEKGEALLSMFENKIRRERPRPLRPRRTPLPLRRRGPS